MNLFTISTALLLLAPALAAGAGETAPAVPPAVTGGAAPGVAAESSAATRAQFEQANGEKGGRFARQVAQRYADAKDGWPLDRLQALAWLHYASLTGSDAAWRLLAQYTDGLSAAQLAQAEQQGDQLVRRFKVSQLVLREERLTAAQAAALDKVAAELPKRFDPALYSIKREKIDARADQPQQH